MVASSYSAKRAKLGTLSDLSDEVLVQILQHLESRDLASIALLNSSWYRMCKDEQIWKVLFQRNFRDSLYLPPQTSWKALYRLQTNWRTGRATSTHLSLRNNVLPVPPSSLSLGHSAEDETDRFKIPSLHPSTSASTSTIVRFHGNYIFTATTAQSNSELVPAVHVEKVTPEGTSVLIGRIYSQTILDYYAKRPHLANAPSLAISELQIDETTSRDDQHFRIAVFYTSGQFALLKLGLGDISVVEEYAHVTVTSQVVQAARYSCPLLVTVGNNSHLKFHLLRKTDEQDVFNLESSASYASNLSWQPSVLDLKRVGKYRFKASFVHASPYYSFPSTWTVGMQEFTINIPKETGSGLPMTISSQTATCIPSTSYASASSPLITSIQQSGRFIVSSKLDNTIDLHEVVRGPRSMAILHRQTLFGHTTSVQSVSLRGAKCISGGRDGKLRVWQLDQVQQRAIEVQEEQQCVSSIDLADEGDKSIEWLSFDEEKIVLLQSSASPPKKPDKLKVLSFM